MTNPLVASPSPLTYDLDGVRRLADAGVGAVVLHSLFEEELIREAQRHRRLVEAGSDSFAESLTYFPASASREPGPAQYLNLIERCAAAVEIPVIASLNGATPGGWIGYARSMEEAGAAALELNINAAPPSPELSGRQVEQRHLDVLGGVKAVLDIPVAVKLSPSLSSVGEMALRLESTGADALVFFNRLLHPDIDAEALKVVPGVGLSTPGDARLPRTWIALLRRRLRTHLAASTGVEGPGDVAAYLLAGADVVMTTSALLRHGPEYVSVLLEGLAGWMTRKGFDRVGPMRGLLSARPDTAGVDDERAGYVAALRAANAAQSGPW